MASPAASTEHWLAIEGMDCAACAAPIEAALQGHEAVASARVSVATGRACLQMRTVDVPPALEAELMARVQAQGFSGDEAVMAAFESNKSDASRVGGN